MMQGIGQVSSRARRFEVEVSMIPTSALFVRDELTTQSWSGRSRALERRRLGALGKELRRKALCFGDALHFDRDCIDRLLQLLKLEILYVIKLGGLPLRRKPSNETDRDRRQCAGEKNHNDRNLGECQHFIAHKTSLQMKIGCISYLRLDPRPVSALRDG
jgi:hypothetical protein